MSKKIKEIVLANPRGFCAGVDRAIDIVEKSLEKYDEPVFVRHQVVHNKRVVESLEKKGVKFVKEVSEIPDNAVAIFSAHGVSSAVENEAKSRDFMYFDATCPLVTKVHLEVQKHAKKGRDIILIGHKGHPEVVGTLGRHPKDSGTNIYLIETREDIDELEVNSDSLAYVTQTTLSVDETTELIEILKRSSLILSVQVLMIFVMQHKIDRTQLNNYLLNVKLCWLLVQRQAQTLIGLKS